MKNDSKKQVFSISSVVLVQKKNVGITLRYSRSPEKLRCLQKFKNDFSSADHLIQDNRRFNKYSEVLHVGRNYSNLNLSESFEVKSYSIV